MKWIKLVRCCAALYCFPEPSSLAPSGTTGMRSLQCLALWPCSLSAGLSTLLDVPLSMLKGSRARLMRARVPRRECASQKICLILPYFALALKVRMPKQFGSEEGRDLYPLDTNLLKTPVAGIGVQLHFNFQLLRCKDRLSSSLSRRVSRSGSFLFHSGGQPRFFLIVWALAIGLAWLILALSVDDALLILGTRRAKTARQNCILVDHSDSRPLQHKLAVLLLKSTNLSEVAWGFETQQRLMWTKIDFVVSLLGTQHG